MDSATFWIGSPVQQLSLMVVILGLLVTSGAALTIQTAEYQLAARRASLAAVAGLLLTLAGVVFAFQPS